MTGRRRTAGVLGIVAVLTVLGIAAAMGASASPALPGATGELLGGRKYYLCVLGQALKIGGLILVRPDVVLVGAIVGGLACGFGW